MRQSFATSGIDSLSSLEPKLISRFSVNNSPYPKIQHRSPGVSACAVSSHIKIVCIIQPNIIPIEEKELVTEEKLIGGIEKVV